MSSLKSFLYGVAPIVGMSPAALYERQRALVKLGLLTVTPGRGPGSGVPLTAESVAVMVICLLAAESLGDVDQRVAALCNALPHVDQLKRHRWERHGGGPTFRSEVACVLTDQPTKWRARDTDYRGIRVSRCWRGQIVRGRGALLPVDYFVDALDRYKSDRSISITAEIEDEMLWRLITFTRGALSQTEEIVEEGEQ
jgi:hypothetical protein